MGEKRLMIAVLPAVLVGLICVGAGPGASRLPSAPAKKKCKIVVKIVHGHKRRVRVCHTVKPKPKPASVNSISLTLDASHAASKPIAAADGGTITTTAANGTKLALTIPKDALVTDETVTMTPVKSVSGLPAGVKFLGGAQFGPEGTALLGDATLTIETPAVSSAQKLRAIAWQGTGSSPLTYGATRSGSQAQVKVVHFSGYGAADGELLSTVARQALQARYPQVLQEMNQATTTDSLDAAIQALKDGQDWLRSTELVDDPSFMSSERAALEALIPKIERNAIEKSYERCKSQHDVGKELGNLLGLERGAIYHQNADNEKLAKDDFEKCGTFQLDFETVLTTTTSAPVTGTTISETSHVRVQSLPLRLFGAETVIPPPVSAPLDVVGFNYHYHQETGIAPLTSTCDGSTAQASPTEELKVFRLQISPDATPMIELELTPGKLETDVTVTCTTPGPGGIPTTYTFQQHVTGVSNQFNEGHKLDAGQNGLIVKDWDYLGGSVWARKTVTSSVTMSEQSVTTTIDEQTTFDLKHVPE